jgi:hypothetical protein
MNRPVAALYERRRNRKANVTTGTFRLLPSHGITLLQFTSFSFLITAH